MDLTLTALEPEFIRYHQDATGIYSQTVDSIDQCQGLRFLCPKCFQANNGPVGTHKIICWSATRGVPETATPGPGRWIISGTSVHDVTLSAEPGCSNSVWLRSGCRWHGFVEEGLVHDA